MNVDVAIINTGEDRQIAAKLAHHLKLAGIDVWVDPDALVKGFTPVRSVQEALASCRIVLSLCSESAFSKHFIGERKAVARYVRQKRDPILILVRIEDCQITSDLSFQADQIFDVLEPSFRQDADRLAALLNEKLARRLVFICHSHKDKEVVDKIVANLQTSPEIELWYDSTALQPGSVIRREIEAGIERADYLLAVMSRNAIDRIDGWIGFELDQAYEKERERNLFSHHFVIPVLIDKRTKMPGWLGTKLWVDLTKDFEVQLNELRRSLCMPFPKHPWQQ